MQQNDIAIDTEGVFDLMNRPNFRSGDLCKYLSRMVILVGDPYRYPEKSGPQPITGWWVEAIEIDDNVFRRIRCDALLLLQKAKVEKRREKNGKFKF